MLERKTVEKTIGKGFADKLDEVIIDVSNSLTFTRREMVEKLGCANFIAASRLSKVLRRLKITTPNQLYKMDPFSLSRARGIGETSVFVAMCVLDAHDYSVEEWWGWNDNTLKFSSFKSKAIKKASKNGHSV